MQKDVLVAKCNIDLQLCFWRNVALMFMAHYFYDKTSGFEVNIRGKDLGNFTSYAMSRSFILCRCIMYNKLMWQLVPISSFLSKIDIQLHAIKSFSLARVKSKKNHVELYFYYHHPTAPDTYRYSCCHCQRIHFVKLSQAPVATVVQGWMDWKPA